MNTYIALFVIASCASLALTPVARRMSERYGWLDVPRDERRVHQRAVPRLGGVAVFASVLITLAVLLFVDNSITQSLVAYRLQILITLVPATLLLLFGMYDDLRGADARLKFTAQGLASLLLYLSGGAIEALSIPFVGSVALPPVLAFAVTMVWMIGITNAFNLIDGIDGLAVGAALFASLVMVAVALILNNPLTIVTSVILAGALAGFLRYNFNPASIFLGDSGSLFVGFLLAALSMQGTQKASTAVAIAIPLVAFGLPIVDTGLALVRRFISGRPLFKGDREHIHHMLLARGWSQRRVALVLYGVCALFGLLSLLTVNNSDGVTGFLLFIVSVAIVLAVGRLRYHEVDEIKAIMRRNVTNGRLRASSNVSVRRASRAMSESTTINELFDAVQEILKLGEFVYATVQLGPDVNSVRILRAPVETTGAHLMRGVQVDDGVIRWFWERGDIEAAEIMGSSKFWCLRLPLSTKRETFGYINLYREFGSDNLSLDINYLCSFFQREMSQAAERMLGTTGGRQSEPQFALYSKSGH